MGSGLSIIIDGKTGEERRERGETDLGFDGTGQVQGSIVGQTVQSAVRQIKLIQTATSPLSSLLFALEINI